MKPLEKSKETEVFFGETGCNITAARGAPIAIKEKRASQAQKA
jgi:hypothetical protein